MREPVIFLDVDGVLNSGRWFSVRAQSKAPIGLRSIDPAAVGLLNQLVDLSGAKVVISSSWRLFRPRNATGAFARRRMSGYLKRRGFIGEVIGVTPDPTTGRRGHEIEAWLKSQKPKPVSFVILDDDSDMEGLAHRHVKTSFESGLQPEHVGAALRILEGRYRPREERA